MDASVKKLAQKEGARTCFFRYKSLNYMVKIMKKEYVSSFRTVQIIIFAKK